MKNKILIGLLIAIIFQFLVLSGMYVSAAMPLWTGTEIKVKTLPVDPRSMFRGNYARLRYEFSQIEDRFMPEKIDLRDGEVVYVILKPGDDDLYEFSGVSLDKPEGAVYLRGRIENRYRISVKYGIEAFFAPKEKALALEKDLRDGGIAVLMVSKHGKARIKDVTGE